ncbi:hypothetical protein SCMC78_64670 [Streptomyces sp. CMC78]|uniref:Uncharacterized protein n=1 Tax=Streptomyces sp. CMC78 TaxID=3231512 RepID=A0AB33KQ90_9ACTN
MDEDAAAVAGVAEATVPAPAAAASAAVRTVLREVGLVMVVTPGRMRKVVCGCRSVRQLSRLRAGSGQRFGNRRRTNMGLDHWRDLRWCAAHPGAAPCRNVPWSHGRPGPPRR